MCVYEYMSFVACVMCKFVITIEKKVIECCLNEINESYKNLSDLRAATTLHTTHQCLLPFIASK